MNNLRYFREKFPEAKKNLEAELRAKSLLTDGPYTLASGELSDWYLDGRRTFMDGAGAVLVAHCVLGVLDADVDAIGGMTMGADPIAVATAVIAATHDLRLRAFSVRKSPKEHGTGGRLVGPLEPGDMVAVLEDTTTTGSALLEAIEAVQAEGMKVAQAIAVTDRSEGKVEDRLNDAGILYTAITTPGELFRA